MTDQHQLTDDVDSRAADLMARLAARQSQHTAVAPEPEPEVELEVELEVGVGVGVEEVAPPTEPPAPEPEPELPSSDATKRTRRRMAPPPWQPAGQSLPDSHDYGREAQPPAPNPQPVRRAGPPPPPPGWNPPPPPPGWPGPPPWMPPHRGGPPTSGGELVPRREAPIPAPRADLPVHEEVPDGEQLTPQFGWRRMLHRATKGRVNPGVSHEDREQQALVEKIRQPLATDFRIAVLSIKGGVGKTTTTIGLGSAFAMVRSDRVIAVDANPDRGTLAERISDSSTSSTVRDLLLDPHVSRYADVRHHTRLAPSRLEVLASVQDPAVSEVFGESDYRRAIEILQAHYNIILTDCGTGIMHSSMASVLDLAHALVLVSSPAVDAARSAAATLDWLTQHGYGGLARESHVVLSGVRPGSGSATFDEVFQYFEERSGSIHVVPFEPHLARGADVDFAMLSPDAVRAYLELAGAVAAKFSRVR